MENNKIVAQENEMQEAEKTGIVDFNSKKQEKEVSKNYTHKFKKPVEIEGRTYETMTFYFEKLNGEDIEAIEEELQNQNKYVISPEVSSAFQSALAARAAGVGADEIKRLPVGEYLKIKNKARDFLMTAGY